MANMPQTFTWNGETKTNFRTPTREELKMPTKPLSEDEVDGLRRWAGGFPFGDLTGAAVLRLLDEMVRLRLMVHDLREGAAEHGFTCGPYLRPGDHANFCGTFNGDNCPLCGPVVSPS